MKRQIVEGLIAEAEVLIEQWRREYNQVRPHSSLGYQPPAPEAILTMVTRQQVVSLMGTGHLGDSDFHKSAPIQEKWY
jgi:hypothetical protein